MIHPPSLAPIPARRWAISLADLSLLVACVLLLSLPPAGDRPAGRVAPAQLVLDAPLSDFFVPGQAVLLPAARARLRAIRSRNLRITVGSAAGGSARLDGWELAAARTAAIARMLEGQRPQLAAPAGDMRVRLERLAGVHRADGTALASSPPTSTAQRPDP